MSSLFVTYFGAISCYTVIAGKSFQEVSECIQIFNRNSHSYNIPVYKYSSIVRKTFAGGGRRLWCFKKVL